LLARKQRSTAETINDNKTKVLMGKLKLGRKRVSSPQSIQHITMIIAENWGEIWDIVHERARTKSK
jgi:hypothetical protein